MGRLTRDPEMRYSNAAEPMAICRFGLAVDRRVSREKRDSGEPTADFINCVAFRHNAEFVERYFRKGQMVSIVGRLQIRQYDDNNGQRQFYTEVLVEEQFFAESRASFENRSSGQQHNNQAYGNQGTGNYGGGQPQGQPYPPQDGFSQQPQQPSSDAFFEVDNNLDDSDLPF